MGINIHVYSYYGFRTEWNQEFSDAYEEVYEANIERYGYNKEPADAQIEVLMDGMSCEYMVFGVRLYDSGDSRWGEMTNSNEIEISDEILAKMKHEYMEQFKRLYPDQYEWASSFPWKLVNFVHYS